MKRFIISLLLLTSSDFLHAQMGGTPDQCITRYGKLEREAIKTSGLLYFRTERLCYIAHFYRNHCDVLSIFSNRSPMGIPEGLSEEQIADLLQSEGGGQGWTPVERFSINGVWNSPDSRSFAIYDTMRHKLVIMTRDSYKREKKTLESTRQTTKLVAPPE